MKCQHGKEDCIHINTEHDEDCCFNGEWDHHYVCQECGFSFDAKVYRMIKNDKGIYIPPEFKPKNCPRCKSEKSLV